MIGMSLAVQSNNSVLTFPLHQNIMGAKQDQLNTPAMRHTGLLSSLTIAQKIIGQHNAARL